MLLPTAWSCGMPLIGRQWEHMGHHFIEYHLQFGCVRFWGVYNGNMWRCSKYDKGERGWWNLERGDFCMRVSHSSIQQKAWTLVGLLPIHLKRRGVKRLWGTSNIIWCQINYNRGAYSQSQPHELSTWYWEFDHVWTKFWRGQYQYCHDTCPWSWVRTNEQSTHTLEIAWYVWTNFWLQNLIVTSIQGVKINTIPSSFMSSYTGQICTALYLSRFWANSLKRSVMGAVDALNIVTSGLHAISRLFMLDEWEVVYDYFLSPSLLDSAMGESVKSNATPYIPQLCGMIGIELATPK